MKILNDFVLTHTDLQGKISLLVHLDCGCNFKCYKCYNYKDLIENRENQTWAAPSKLFDYLKRNDTIYDYIILSGGEPTLCNYDLIDFCKKLKNNFSTQISLNTNGSLPSVLKKLINERLIDNVSMDLKFPVFDGNFNYYKNIWEQIYGIKFNQVIYDNICMSLEYLYSSFLPFELRTVKYPFLKKSFLRKYRETVKKYNDYYKRDIKHTFNDFYDRGDK